MQICPPKTEKNEPYKNMMLSVTQCHNSTSKLFVIFFLQTGLQLVTCKHERLAPDDSHCTTKYKNDLKE